MVVVVVWVTHLGQVGPVSVVVAACCSLAPVVVVADRRSLAPALVVVVGCGCGCNELGGG